MFASTTQRSGPQRNQRLLEALSGEIQRCAGLWIVAGDFNMELGVFGQFAKSAGHARSPHLQTRSIGLVL